MRKDTKIEILTGATPHQSGLIFRCRPATVKELSKITRRLEEIGVLSWHESDGARFELNLSSFSFGSFGMELVRSASDIEEAAKKLPRGDLNLGNFAFGPTWPELNEHYFGLNFEEIRGEFTLQIRSSLLAESILSSHIDKYRSVLTTISNELTNILGEKPILIRFKGPKGVELF